mgnify:CR=1 FL=1|jgi:hypothetical protein
MYGMQINDALGNTYYDSTSEAGIFVEFLTLFITGSGLDRYITYNGVDGKANLQGRRLRLVTLYSGDHWHEAVDNGTSGYPQIKYNETKPNVPVSNVRRGTILMVLAR